MVIPQTGQPWEFHGGLAQVIEGRGDPQGPAQVGQNQPHGPEMHRLGGLDRETGSPHDGQKIG